MKNMTMRGVCLAPQARAQASLAGGRCLISQPVAARGLRHKIVQDAREVARDDRAGSMVEVSSKDTAQARRALKSRNTAGATVLV